MPQTRTFPRFTVTEKAEASVKAGHPWIYHTELLEAQPCEDGALADVYSRKGKYLGTGFFNSHSKIRIRILSRNANDRFDEAFFERRLRYAVEYGNRLIMMMNGKIIYDVCGQEKKDLQVSDLLKKFEVSSGEEFASDRMLLV